MSERLAGKIILVTGASGGIGRAIVDRIEAEGATAIAADLVAEKDGIAIDVRDEAQWIAALAEVERRHGRLDGLVNNAGINQSAGGETPEDFLIDDLHRMFAVNVDGMALGCKHAMPLMAKGGGGSIVNMASIAGSLPCDFIAAYGASKSAVAHWTKSVALHCARKASGIRCNSVHPGSVLTGMMDDLFARMAAKAGITPAAAEAGLRGQIPMGRYQEPIDIANAVLFLLSDEARFVTGIELVVDGGMMLAN